ncbi:DUF2303 family protein [Amycolatopsis taiwanensis]|uniref:DUF2303 family protein n=1 Tax=Amycolatopsis taiwanensis TaxID=342230 RepID=UPI0004B10D5F|nr:DUF2303 family protein [Amycolatopsis taiwanensis]
MTQPSDMASAAERVEDLARRVAAVAKPEPYTVETALDSIIVRTERNDESTVVHDLERLLDYPRRHRGTATLYDPADFIAYVQRLADTYTTVWGDEDKARFTAVFNDHADADFAGWRDHTATLQLQLDPEWRAWQQHDGKWFAQLAFAEFLEDHAAAILEPAPADFLEVATTFKAHRKAEFSGGVNLTTGDVQLTYNEETTAKATRAGQIEVPRQFTVALAPFLGTPARGLAARLRWTVDGGQLSIGYKLHRPDLAQRDAFADIRQTIAEGLNPGPDDHNVPVLLGAAPAALTPQR